MMKIIPTHEAIGMLPVPNPSVKPITVIGTDAIRNSFDEKCLQQAINSRLAPGVTDLVLTPDAHAGYGAPVGCVMVSPTHIYPGPVGVDIKCSMSLLQMDLPETELATRETRRAVINALLERLSTGAGKGQRSVKKSRHVSFSDGRRVAVEGASAERRVVLLSGSRRTGQRHAKTRFISDTTDLAMRWQRVSIFTNGPAAENFSTRSYSSSDHTAGETTSAKPMSSV
jgi:RNA-splicing ligase RtcB